MSKTDTETENVEDKPSETKEVSTPPKKELDISTNATSTIKSISTPQAEEPCSVPKGWSRTTVMRQGGATAGKYDIYFFSPNGKKLRSKKEIQSYCEKNNIEIDIDDFVFKKSSITPTSAIPARMKRPSNALSSKSKTLSPKKMSDTPKSASLKRNALLSPGDEDSLTPKPKKKRMAKSVLKVSSAGITKINRKINTWVPPASPFNLFQEKLYTKPWQLLIGTIFLNKSSGEDNVSYEFLVEFLKKWPTPEKTMNTDWETIADSLNTMSNKEKKAKMIIKFSDEFVTKKWTYPKELHGIGKYGNDSYRVFCLNEWKKVKPSDYLLNFFVDWLWDNHVVLSLD